MDSWTHDAKRRYYLQNKLMLAYCFSLPHIKIICYLNISFFYVYYLIFLFRKFVYFFCLSKRLLVSVIETFEIFF